MAEEGADYLEAGTPGAGHRVILLHSSVAGARQWRALMDSAHDRYHLIALNLFGYGATPPWSGDAPQTLADQAGLIAPFLPDDGSRVSIVGHSFGGSVAMKAAALFPGRVRRLVLIEPNPFYLLSRQDAAEAFEEALALRAVIKSAGETGAWPQAAAVFADYWTGAGSWDAMPEARREKFADALRPNFHEWDGVMNETASMAEWVRDLPPETTVISSADTVLTIERIVAIMAAEAPGWRFERIPRGGHMAALSQPDLVNPLILRALE